MQIIHPPARYTSTVLIKLREQVNNYSAIAGISYLPLLSIVKPKTPIEKYTVGETPEGHIDQHKDQ